MGGVVAKRGERREVALGIVGALARRPVEVRVIGEKLAGVELERGAVGNRGRLQVALGLGATGALVVLLEELAVGGHAACADLVAVVLEFDDACARRARRRLCGAR